MKKTLLIPFSMLALIYGSAGHAQIQSFEFGYGLTNTLAIPAGKIIRIHSLIGISTASFVDTTYSNGRDSVSQAVSLAQTGIAIKLGSGREINLSPYNLSVAGGTWSFATATVSSINSSTPYSPLIIPGPITIEKKGEPTTLLVYEILDNVGSSSSPQTPSQGSSVVVPTSAVGDVDVKMEQSADNVTWTECLPGTYNSSTVKRFFRLRAVEK